MSRIYPGTFRDELSNNKPAIPGSIFQLVSDSAWT